MRRADEYAAPRIDGALNIPIHELWQRLDEVPAGEVWVHCAARLPRLGRRLDAGRGRTASSVAVDDEFDNAAKVGLHLVGPEA